MLAGVAERCIRIAHAIRRNHSRDETPPGQRPAMAPVSAHRRHHRSLPSLGIPPRVPHLSRAWLALFEFILLRPAAGMEFRSRPPTPLLFADGNDSTPG